MKSTAFSLFLIAILIFSLGCSTENPLCTDNYCVEGEIYARADLEDDQEFSDLPPNINEESVKKLWTLEVDKDFEPITVTGLADWDILSTDWEYQLGGVSYLKKLTLEFESDEGEFGENRVILVHLNNDTVSTDSNFVDYVDFLGTVSVHLTHHIGIATFKGDVVGAPIKE